MEKNMNFAAFLSVTNMHTSQVYVIKKFNQISNTAIVLKIEVKK